jgi:hypothetical protein
MPSARPAGPGFFPLDEELALGAGAFSPYLQQCLVRLGTWLPFTQVPEGLAHFTKVTVSRETARRVTEAAGVALVAVETAAAERLEREGAEVPPGPPLQQVSVDGAMVPLVHGEWAEVKTLAIGTVEQRRRGDGTWAVQTTALSYFSRLVEAEQFRRLAGVEIHRRGVANAARVCGLVDGAEWCQKFLDWHCPRAVRILDFPHAAEHVSGAAQTVFGAGSSAAQAWLGAQLHELKHGDPDAVLAALQALPPLATVVAEPAQTPRGVWQYLSSRREHIAYAQFQAAGYPIGSGAVESANKLVVEARLKGSGMHWARANVNPMVALRAVVCSDRWAEAWPGLWHQRRAEAAARCRQRHDQRRPAPASDAPAPPGAAAGARPAAPRAVARLPLGPRAGSRPTANHPWRKPFIRRRCAEASVAKS